MELLLLLPLLSLVTCAPLGEQANPLEGLEDINSRVKKAEEFAMYNEQNAPHETAEKRSDPSGLEDESIDLTGEVKANEATEIHEDESHSDETDLSNSAGIDSEVADIEEPLNTEENPENANSNEENEFNSEEIVEQMADADASTEPDEKSKTEESDFADVDGTEDYLSNYKHMLGELANKPYPDERWGQLYDNNAYYGFPQRSRYQRYRRSQNRRFNNAPLLSRAVKRNRRIKRDLFYPGTGLQQEYDPYEESYLYDPYETYQPTGNDLLDLLDNARQYDEDNYGNYLGGNGYEWPEESLDDLVYEEEPKYYVPKRQAGLTFVPGIKRSRPFYPYYEEPKTHFSAFVPKKRTWNKYENEYERVMRLAAALRDAQSEYPEDYGYALYRRRK